MSVSVSKTLLFPSLTNIKFGDLRSSFKETPDGAISASELRRNTSTTTTTPIVPDAIENVSVSTLNNLKVSQFQNTIKYYDLNQTGTDLNLDLYVQTWNSNLYKNIRKRVNINGTCGSNSVSSAALNLSGIMYNVFLIINGSVLGAGGPAASAGGNAMSLVSAGNAITVTTSSAAAVYGGGGGGRAGATGAGAAAGPVGTCSYVSSYTTGTNCGGCPGCDSGYSTSCYPVDRCGFKNNSTLYQSLCQKTVYYNTPAPAGGAGGAGGLGQGYNQTRTNGTGGSAGSTSSCGGNSNVTQTQGATGETGGDGGDWGINGSSTTVGSGGASGRSISGSNYTVDPNAVSAAFKGLK